MMHLSVLVIGDTVVNKTSPWDLKLYDVLVLCNWYEHNTWASTGAAANISAKDPFGLKLQEYVDILQIDKGGRNINRGNTVCECKEV